MDSRMGSITQGGSSSELESEFGRSCLPEEKDKRPNTLTSFMWLEPKLLIHTRTLVLVLRVMVLVFFF